MSSGAALCARLFGGSSPNSRRAAAATAESRQGHHEEARQSHHQPKGIARSSRAMSVHNNLCTPVLVPVDSITMPENRLRPIDPTKVSDLAASLKQIGLQNPISIYTNSDDKRILVTGAHRAAAAKQLGDCGGARPESVPTGRYASKNYSLHADQRRSGPSDQGGRRGPGDVHVVRVL